MKAPANASGSTLTTDNLGEAGENKEVINPELWQTLAGPLVNLPAAGTHVVYFPQGHSEQVAASVKKNVDAQIPNYSNLQSKLLCILHSVKLHADPETDEVYAQMILQPVASFDTEALLKSDLTTKINKPQTQFFCKTLTASDTSTHGGFSVPRRAAEKIFPPLDFSMQPPAQELVARDLHDTVWTFRHIFRGQPKRHLLTTGWSLFVSGKRLSAGDSVLFIRDEKQQLLLGIRRANRQVTNVSSSVLSSDSMHIGILAAAAHAAANNSSFSMFYNPRASPSEFVIPLAKYYKAVCSNQISLGMRFRMMFETEESGTRRYMGTITGISDLDPVRWKNSQWRNLQVGWDESSAGERRTRVSIWEIEPVTAPFFICPTTPFYQPKRPRQPGMPDDELIDLDNVLKRRMPWVGEDPGLSLVQWMNMQQSSSLANSMQPNYLNPLLSGSVYGGSDLSRQLDFSAPQMLTQNNIHVNTQRSTIQPVGVNPLASMMQPQKQLTDPSQQLIRQSLMNQRLPQNQIQSPLQNVNLYGNFQQQQQQQPVSQSQHNLLPSGQQLQTPDNQIQLQYLQKLHHHQQQQPKLHSSQRLSETNQISANGRSLLTGTPGGGGQSGITDDVPSCSTSPSTNHCPNIVPSTITSLPAHLTITDVEAGLTNTSFVKSSTPVNILKSQTQGFLAPVTYLNNISGTQMDFVDSSSSATSVRVPQNDLRLQHHNSDNLSLDSHLAPHRNGIQDGEVQDDPRVNIPFISNNLGMPSMILDPNPGGVILSYDNQAKDAQPELSSSVVSQSFGVPDIAFNPIDSTLDDSSLLNGGVWAPPPQQFQRIRTYTKVYKRGAVGRSIDISAYSGYEELKQDLARRFGIEGELEDEQRVGWKLVYVDHENDVLLVGDDPWEEFVSCVRCIKILSPQEVQQMSLDGDFGGNNVLPNHACSSSDGGNV